MKQDAQFEGDTPPWHEACIRRGHVRAVPAQLRGDTNTEPPGTLHNHSLVPVYFGRADHVVEGGAGAFEPCPLDVPELLGWQLSVKAAHVVVVDIGAHMLSGRVIQCLGLNGFSVLFKPR